MLNEYKKPMWNDGFAKEQPWLNYFNEYERTHCCFGDGGDGNGASDAEDSGMTADQAAAVGAAADAAAAAGMGSEAQQAAADAQAAEEQGIDVGEVDSGLAGADVSVQEMDALEDLGLIGYNDLDALGYFDKVDAGIAAHDQTMVDQKNAELAAAGLDAIASVGPDGTWSYDGTDAMQAFGIAAGQGVSDIAGAVGTGIGGLASAVTQLSPGAIVGHAIGAPSLPSFMDPAGIGPGVQAAVQGMLGDFSTVMSDTPQSTLDQVEGYEPGLGADAGIGEFDPSPAQTAVALGGLDSLGEGQSAIDAQIASTKWVPMLV